MNLSKTSSSHLYFIQPYRICETKKEETLCVQHQKPDSLRPFPPGSSASATPSSSFNQKPISSFFRPRTCPKQHGSVPRPFLASFYVTKRNKVANGPERAADLVASPLTSQTVRSAAPHQARHRGSGSPWCPSQPSSARPARTPRPGHAGAQGSTRRPRG